MQKSAVAKCLLLVTLLLVCEYAVASTYRKPPFNGSIFGKRAPNAIDYDNSGKALAAMCEIASEACASWFPLPRDESK